MKPIIPVELQETVTIKRYTAGTRSTATTIASSVKMYIEPVGGGARLNAPGEMTRNAYQGMLVTPLSTVQQLDRVVRSDGTELVIQRIDRVTDVQQFVMIKDEVL